MPAIGRKNQPQSNVEQIEKQLAALTTKRQRILDAYFEGVISGTERDARAAEVDRERKAFELILNQERPRADISLETLADTFAPFVEFDLLNRDDKRALLNTLTPSIVVSNYEVKGMFIGLDMNPTAMFYHANEGLERIWLPIAA